MKRNYLALLLVVCTSPLIGDVTLLYDFGDFFSANGSQAPVSSYAVLVADTGSDGFLGAYTSAANANFSAFGGTSLTVGSALSGSGNDEIVGVFTMTDFGGASGFSGTLTGINVVSGSLAAGQQLAIYWFPTITTTSIAGSVSEYGFFRSDSPVSNSDIGFIMPGDGSNVNLFALTVSATGDLAESALTAVAVPEPSTYAAIFGALALGFVAYRRRRS
jgi:hypothetical protein